MISPNHHSGSPALVARPLFALTVSLLGMISLTMTACGPDNPLSALAALASFSEEEFEALAQEAQAFNELIEALSLVDVRIVNNTDVIAEIEIQSAIPQPDTEAIFFGLPQPDVGFPSFETIDSKTVRVLPGGTVTGSIKCGEVIGISIRAPFNAPSADRFNDNFGLFIQPGNVQISGIGLADDSFTGDIPAMVRFVQPDTDALDCANGTLVIRIDTPATIAEGADTSDIIQTLGSASLSAE